MSVLSYPDRGPWGKSSYRGNCSGYVYEDLFKRLKPPVFVDPCVGGGTSIDVAKSMGIECYGLDLRYGFNVVRDSILEAVGKHADLVFSHVPYHDMVIYSGPGGMWGIEPHPDDLSRCASVDEFNEKIQLTLLNQREATLPGGYYGTLIGDLRRDGKYYSFQAEAIARMDSRELAAVLIKQQHNVQSDSKRYGRMVLPRIEHEYILLFRRSSQTVVSLLTSIACQAHSRLTGTWKNIVRQTLMEIGGKAHLAELYEAVEKNAPQKAAGTTKLREKVRQTLQLNPAYFASEERGVWKIA